MSSPASPTPTILDRILATKREEIATLLKREKRDELIFRCADLPPTRGFQATLRTANETRNAGDSKPKLIAEVKKASPSKGVIRHDFDPIAIARSYQEGGASCLSVLTDEQYFQGNLSYLAMIREVVSLPLLRKDFLIDAAQIYEARLAGADAILLIVSAIPSPARLAEMRGIAEMLGMDALVEVHDEDELALAIESGATLIGVNNRDLKTFHVDLAIFERLAPYFPTGTVAVAESGIFTPADIARVGKAGANAVLVGESLMRENDVTAAVRQLLTF